MFETPRRSKERSQMDSTYSSFSNLSSCESTSLIANNSITTAKEQKKPKKKGGGKLSTDPQSVAARQRRHRISDRFKILQSLVPGGSKMDTVSMLEEAIQYVKFLKNQIRLHQSMISTLVHHDNYADHRHDPAATTFTYDYNDNNCSSFDHYNNHSSSSWDQMLRGGEMISTDDQLGSMPWFHCDEDGPNFDAPMPGEFND